MTLEVPPRERTVHSFVVTRAAQQALSMLTERYSSGPGHFFWLADPPGAGKTHFLNYLIALRRRLARVEDSGRELVLAIDYAEADSAVHLESDILGAIARELGSGHGRGIPLWRRMQTEAAFEVALSEARRAGIRALTLAVDFGLNLTPHFANDLLSMARSSRSPSLIVVAAGRGEPARDAVPIGTGPADLNELFVVAVSRARRLDSRWTAMVHLYREIETARLLPEEIFPFHPESLRVLAALAEPEVSVAGLARMARDAVAAHKDTASLIYPFDLFEASEPRRIIAERLGPDGRAALRDAMAAIPSIPRHSRHPAEQIIRTLALAHLCGQTPALEIEQLWRRLPAPPATEAGQDRAQERYRTLEELASNSGGTITASPMGAAFVPPRKTNPGIEAFNKALPLLKLFDPALDPVRDASELSAAMARLDQSLSGLFEEAQRVSDNLSRFALVSRGQPEPGPEVRSMIDSFFEMTQGGARGLLEQGADENRRMSGRAIVAGYQELAAAAASVPALLAMKEYLEQTRLEPDKIERRDASEILALATERRLLEAELGPRAPYSRTRDALQARFETFKWTYVERYRAAHERWRIEMEKASVSSADFERCLQALERLDSIPALGPPLAAQFHRQAHESRGGLKICTLAGEFSAYAAAICPLCDYVLGSASPWPAIAERLDKVQRALKEKLAALSRGAIARLIRKHDHAHRLEGFLKITQAAQTQALAGVLDDDLTAYIARLLSDRAEGDSARRTSR